MKTCTFTVEFTSHVLANYKSKNKDERDHFQRDSDGRLIFQQSWFFAAFSQAIKIARVRGIKPADINMDLAVKAETGKYRRKYKDFDFRTHEAIMPGTRVTFEAVVADHVTSSNLQEILDKMGRFVGLSPYGYNLGYGRFKLLSVEIAASDKANTSTTQTCQPVKVEVKTTG